MPLFEARDAAASGPRPFLKAIRRLGLGLALAGAAHGVPAAAAVIDASSAAFGEAVSIGSAPPVGLTLNIASGPLPTAAGAAPAPYNATQTAASALVTGILSTGLLTATAASSVDGLPGARTANASTAVNSLAIGIPGVLDLAADTVFSSADIGGSPGALLPLGATTITNLRLAGTLIPTTGLAANTVILNAAGVKVTLNEQVLTGAGTDNETLLVNAIDVVLSDAAQPILGDVLKRANLLTGSIVIGQSKASLSAVADAKPVPEPASLLLCAAGLFGVGLCRARRGTA